MSWPRVVVALTWMVATTVAQASGAFPLSGSPESTPKALLSVPSASGGAFAVRTEPSPAPDGDTKGLPSLVGPVAPRSTSMRRTAERGTEIVERLAARPHRQRGPPTPA